MRMFRTTRPVRAGGQPPTPAPGRRSRRDRRGRGLRGPLAPPQVPLARSRAERFDDLVLDAVERLERRWSRELDGVEFAVEDVPPTTGSVAAVDPIPLGRALHAVGQAPPRVVIYRRPVEARAVDFAELGSLVHDVVVEQVAELLGVEPEQVDPHYDRDAEDEG